MYMHMQLWTLLHNPSHSIKDSNQTSIIRTNIEAHRYLQKLVFLFLRLGPIPNSHFSIEFQCVKSTFVFRSEKVRVIRVK
jgi:hypothetical protein